jgi:hypothetical protein
VRHLGRGVRQEGIGRGRCDKHGVDLARVDARVGKRGARSIGGQVAHAHAGRRAAT